MKKKLFAIIALCLLSIFFIPIPIHASDPWVTCGNGDNPTACTLDNFKTTLATILKFLIDTIAVPLATVAVIVGGILMMTSAGNPNLMSLGKKVFWSAIIGLVLALGAKVIINFLLDLLKYKGDKLT